MPWTGPFPSGSGPCPFPTRDFGPFLTVNPFNFEEADPMKWFKGLLYAGLASAFLFAISAPAKAALVLTDSGGGTVEVDGAAAGLDLTNFNVQLTEINGGAVLIPASFVTLSLTGTATTLTGSGSKTFGDVVGSQATLDFDITSGVASGPFINLAGTI